MEGFFLIVIIIAVYFLPTIVGWNTKGVGSVFIINLLLGWTLIGWIVALIWAMNSKAETPVYHYTCSYCGYKRSLNQKVKIYVCPQCNEKTEFPLNKSQAQTAKKVVHKPKESYLNYITEKENEDPINAIKKLKSDEIIVKVLGNKKIEVLKIKDWEEIMELGNADKFEIIYQKS